MAVACQRTRTGSTSSLTGPSPTNPPPGSAGLGPAIWGISLSGQGPPHQPPTGGFFSARKKLPEDNTHAGFFHEKNLILHPGDSTLDPGDSTLDPGDSTLDPGDSALKDSGTLYKSFENTSATLPSRA